MGPVSSLCSHNGDLLAVSEGSIFRWNPFEGAWVPYTPQQLKETGGIETVGSQAVRVDEPKHLQA